VISRDTLFLAGPIYQCGTKSLLPSYAAADSLGIRITVSGIPRSSMELSAEWLHPGKGMTGSWKEACQNEKITRSRPDMTWLGSAAQYIGHGSLSGMGPLWVICLGDGLDWLQIVLDLNRPRYRVVHEEVVACLDAWPCAIPIQ
jgi:hypothetical protein